MDAAVKEQTAEMSEANRQRNTIESAVDVPYPGIYTAQLFSMDKQQTLAEEQSTQVAMAFQLFTALVEIMVPSERMCKVKKIRELSKRGVEGEARNETRLLQQELQKALGRVKDGDRVATPCIQTILDGLQAASTKVDSHKLVDIGPMALQSLQVLQRHPNRHIKESAKLAKRKWIYILDPSCSPRPMKRQRCQMSSGQILHKEYFTALSSFRR